ncbi:MAG: 4Fe-4S binding protein [Candidatus Omnitrophota bacterium]|nr:MAG: 4Fe-4S binding protein [Candidatus Omnitrophota bacterium]
MREDEVEVISEVEESVKSFALPPPFILNHFPKRLLPFFRHLLKFRPIIDKKKCVACLACKEVCPTAAVTVKNKIVSINQRKCIMCMCCAEVCRFGAVELNKGILLKILSLAHRGS